LNGVRFPDHWRLETLAKSHKRKDFQSGNPQVDQWLSRSALQSQSKHLTTTKVLLDDRNHIAGYYTLAMAQVDFSDLPETIAKTLPRRQLPIAVLAWLGVDKSLQGKGIGKRLLASALRDCHQASLSFAFIAVLLQCIDEQAKSFYQRFDFKELPGYPMRLYLAFEQLDKLMRPPT
jgi:GNAT superfamily N-acetyltransferase